MNFDAFNSKAAFESRAADSKRSAPFPDGVFFLRFIPRNDAAWPFVKVHRHWLKFPGTKAMVTVVCTEDTGACIGCMTEAMCHASKDPILSGMVGEKSNTNPGARWETHANTHIREKDMDTASGLPLIVPRKIPKALTDLIDMQRDAVEFLHPKQGQDMKVVKSLKNPREPSTATYTPAFETRLTALASSDEAIGYLLANQPDLKANPDFRPTAFSAQVARVRSALPALYSELLKHYGADRLGESSWGASGQPHGSPAGAPASGKSDTAINAADHIDDDLVL